MGFAVYLDVLDPDAAAKVGKPFEVKLGVNTATEEQFATGIKMLSILLDRLISTYEERFLEKGSSRPRAGDGDLEEGGGD